MSDKDVTIKDVYVLLQTINTNLSQKIETVHEEVRELSHKLNKEVIEIKEEIDLLKEENNQLKDRVNNVERLLKKNNLVFYGMNEDPKETKDILTKAILSLLQEKLGFALSAVDISNCFRLGKKTSTNRPVLLELTSNFNKREILAKKFKFKGSNIFVNEDLIPQDLYERKILLSVLKNAKSHNLKAHLKGNKIVIDSKTYTFQDIQERKGLPEELGGDLSPIAPRKATSEPSTPTPQYPQSSKQKTQLADPGQPEEKSLKPIEGKPKLLDSLVHRKKTSENTPTESQDNKKPLPYSMRSSQKK